MNSTTCQRRDIIVLCLFFLVTIFVKENSSEYTTCQSESCSTIGHAIRSGMVTNISACSDFYNYVCGNRREKDFIGRFARNNDIKERKMIDLLKDAIHPTDYKSLKLAKQIFNMCTDNLGDEGRIQLKSILKTAGGWPLLSHSKGTWDPRTKLHNVTTAFDKYDVKGALYHMDVIEDSGRLIPRVSAPLEIFNDTHLLPDVVKYLLNDETVWSSKEFQDSLHRDIIQMQEFMQKLSEIKNSPQYVDIHIDELQEEYNTWFDALKFDNITAKQENMIYWTDIVRNRYPLKSITGSEEPYPVSIKYFGELGTLLGATDTRVIVNYVMWSFVKQMLPYVSETTRNLINYPSEKQQRESKCLYEPNLNVVKNHEYVKMYTPDNVVREVREIVNDVRINLIEQISDTSELDAECKLVAERILLYLKAHIGGPEWYTDANIDYIYKHIQIDPNYLKTILNVLEFNVVAAKDDLRMHRIGVANKEGTTITFPVDSPLIYNPTFGVIPISTDVLNYSYVTGGPPAVNYGLLGSMVSILMTNELNRKYDLYKPRVTFYDACTVNTRARHIKYAEMPIKCFLDRKERFVVYPAVEGLLTAYRAYKKNTKTKNEMRLENLDNYTADRLFFISFASEFCEKEYQRPTQLDIFDDLVETKEFSKVFECSKEN